MPFNYYAAFDVAAKADFPRIILASGKADRK
jgi:hypothetical protein